METKIQQVAVSRLVAHPDNPNRMSGSTFAKLVRNIERTGRYEPLIVRPYRSSARRSLVSRASRPRSAGKMPATQGLFQIINGHHRLEAIKKLGKRKAEVIVWDVDDEQTDILLATLNRLSGSDIVAKKIALLKRLTGKMNARQLGRLLPQTPGQIKKLIDLKMPKFPAKALPETLANAMVFFVSDEQKKVVEDALSLAMPTRPATNAAALTAIARHFLDTASQDNTRNEDQIRTA